MNKIRNPGFTIVELLIVIVVIGILAAITIVAYNGIQDRAKASAASSALSQAAKKLAVYQVDNGNYPSALSAAGVSSSGDVTFQYTSDGTTYCITGTSGNISYRTTNATSPTAGGCAGHGVGGTPAITNMVTNPSFTNDTASWINRGTGVTISRNTTAGNFRSSPASLFTQIGTTTQSDWGAAFATAYVNVTIGDTYSFSSYIKMASGSSAYLTVLWRNSAGTALSYSIANTVTATSFTRSSISATAPPTAATAQVIISGAGSSSFYVDDVMVTAGSTIYNFADGSSPDWVWNGTTNNSTSTGPPL